MNNLSVTSQNFDPTLEEKKETTSKQASIPSINIWKKLRGGFFVVFGYLLSPLCWWNDLLFNLPIAYFFGYVCSFLSENLLLPCTIIGYWLSNIIGILMMQFGAGDIFQKQPQERNLKKEIFNTLISSTAYTLLIMFLLQLKIIEIPLEIFNNS